VLLESQDLWRRSLCEGERWWGGTECQRTLGTMPVHLVRAGRPNLILYCRIQGPAGGVRALGLADIQEIEWKTGPRRVATAIASTPQIHRGTGLSPAWCW